MPFSNRRAVAPVIATLLMVAIAVVGGMLVFVFAQDFFTQTETMAGPTIESLQIFGYDARDVATDGIKNHDGVTCNSVGAVNSILDASAGEVFALYVRNLGPVDVIIRDVSVYNVKATASGIAALTASGTLLTNTWTVLAPAATCGAAAVSASTPIGAGRDGTILVAFGTDFGDDVKSGRPIFVKVETGGGNFFTKQLINGRQVG